jgi:hypothetical protein
LAYLRVFDFRSKIPYQWAYPQPATQGRSPGNAIQEFSKRG